MRRSSSSSSVHGEALAASAAAVVVLADLDVQEQVHAAPEQRLQDGPRPDADLPHRGAPRAHHDLLHAHAVHHQQLLDAEVAVVVVLPAVVDGHDVVGQLLVQAVVHALAHHLDGLVDLALVRALVGVQIPRPQRRVRQEVLHQRVRALALLGADGQQLLERVDVRQLPRQDLQMDHLLGLEQVHFVQHQHRRRHRHAAHVGVLQRLQLILRRGQQVGDARVGPHDLAVGVHDE
mmetsp:Transcript_24800/g.61076  ORF Transcript_24800/g.61076 Transcript_24800/m.61076 type:complete len:234 (+) Transcript_24800:294-995(+)